MTTTRRRSRRGQGELLRDEILGATEDLLIETGSEEAVSIRAVADRVGVTPPSIYRHFTDKQTLLFEVCSRQFERLHARLHEVMDLEIGATDRLVACGKAYVQFGLDHPEHYRIMFMGHSDWTPEQYTDEVVAEGSPFMALVQAVEDAIDDLGIDQDPYQAAVVLWTAMHGITSLLVSKPNFPWPPVDELVADVCESHLRGLFRHE